MISVAIQAGGKSRRMGQDKALVPLAGRPLIEHVLDRVSGLGEDVFITTNNPEPLTYLGVRLVQDIVPGAGALSGLQTALEAARGDPVVVAACDLPFANQALFNYMLQRINFFDVAVPFIEGFYEPMHAVYARSCLPAVRRVLGQGEKQIISFFPQVRVLLIDSLAVRKLDPSGRAFLNINTPDDLCLAAGKNTPGNLILQ
jgi:molybdopterin-guanine dinucleotide biosynthesis protein A